MRKRTLYMSHGRCDRYRFWTTRPVWDKEIWSYYGVGFGTCIAEIEANLFELLFELRLKGGELAKVEVINRDGKVTFTQGDVLEKH